MTISNLQPTCANSNLVVIEGGALGAAIDASAVWDRALSAYRTAKVDFDAFAQIHDRRYAADTLSWHIGRRMDDLGDRLTEAEGILMALPAPDAAALRWKMEYVFEADEEAMPAWSMGQLRQTIADFRRLLPEG